MFLDFCWGLNVLKLSWLAAFLRFAVWNLAHIGRSWPAPKRYDQPDKVGGWKGWHELKGFGTLVFVDQDDRLHYRW
jgi:hypothetical protein